MGDLANNTNLWLSICASFVVIIGGIVSLTRFLRYRDVQKSASQYAQGMYWPQQKKDLGYHFGCVLKTVIIVVLIIALATVLTYVTMAIIALYIESHQPVPYYGP